MICHSIKDCYIFKDIIEDMIKREEIEIEESLSKGPTASSTTTLTVKQKNNSHTSSLEINEGIPTVSLPPHAVPIKSLLMMM